MIVFAGPSLAEIDPSREGFAFRPPAKQGDIYLATLDFPRAIGLIDGYFAGVPAVWHKEILWALSQGIPVLGASSMGALRAAELDVYGMIGVGAVYEGYRDDQYKDDDEVALHHAPAEMGYAALSVPMVNIRATVDSAVAQSVLPEQQGHAIIHAAKALYYGDRTWDRILPSGDDATRNWVHENFVDQKQRDALTLLNRMSAGDFASPRDVIPFHFEHTLLWRRATAEWTRTTHPRKNRDAGGFRLLRDDQFHR